MKPILGGVAVIAASMAFSQTYMYISNADPTGASPGQVHRFDMSGAFVDIFVPLGSGGLTGPHSIGFGPNGNLFCSRYTSGSVLQYDGISGNSVGVFASGNGINEGFGFTFGPDQNMYFGDPFNHFVNRYNGVTGSFIGTFVTSGSGGLNNSRDMEFGPDGNLYVCSSGTSSIKKYSGSTGAYLANITGGSIGSADHITFGPDGNIYLTDASTKVLRFNGSTGAFIDTFVASGSGGLQVARGLAFGPNGDLYVTDYARNIVLRYNGTTGAYIGVAASGNGLKSTYDLTFNGTSQQFTPNTFAIVKGRDFGGGLSDLLAADQSYLFVAPGAVLTSTQDPVQIAVESTVSAANASRIRVRVVTASSSSNCNQSLAMFNFQTQSYTVLDTRVMSLNDTAVTIGVQTGASDYIEPVTKRVRMRISAKQAGAVLVWPFQVRTDQVGWEVTP